MNSHVATPLAILSIFTALALSAVVYKVGVDARKNICDNQTYIRLKLARAMELAAGTHLQSGRIEVFTEFNATVKELRALKC